MTRLKPDGNGNHRHLGGWRRDRPMFGIDRAMAADTSVFQPPAGDLYPLMSQVPVYDQLQLGSCGANMGCTKFRYLEVKAGRAALDVSRMCLYKDVRTLEGTPLTEDSGCEIRDIMKATATYGVGLESDDPYIDDGVQFTLPVTPKESADALLHQALFYYRCADLFTVKASILQGFPVGFGFTVYENMMSDACSKTGEVLFPEEGEKVDGGHANTIIGYDDTKKIGNEVGAVRSRNSWGNDWGQDGDLWLPYRYIIEGLATDFWTLRSVEL